MLSPYGRDARRAGAETPPPASETRAEPAGEDPRLRRLEAQIEALREQLDALDRDRKEG
jgi:hypothetical protein